MSAQSIRSMNWTTGQRDLESDSQALAARNRTAAIITDHKRLCGPNHTIRVHLRFAQGAVRDEILLREAAAMALYAEELADPRTATQRAQDADDADTQQTRESVRPL